MRDGVPVSNDYTILRVDPGADAQEIRSAFRRLARRYHPDVAKSKNAARRFLFIREAYDVLSDPEKRRRYDPHDPRANGRRPRRLRQPPGSSRPRHVAAFGSASMRLVFFVSMSASTSAPLRGAQVLDDARHERDRADGSRSNRLDRWRTSAAG